MNKFYLRTHEIRLRPHRLLVVYIIWSIVFSCKEEKQNAETEVCAAKRRNIERRMCRELKHRAALSEKNLAGNSVKENIRNVF